MRSKKPRRVMPPTLFPLGRAGPRPEASRNAYAFRSHSPGYGGFRGRRGRPAGEHHEHSGARNRPGGARRGITSFLSGLRKPPKGTHHQHQRGSAEGRCVLHGGPTGAERAKGGANTRCVALLEASTCAARPWAQPLEFQDTDFHDATESVEPQSHEQPQTRPLARRHRAVSSLRKLGLVLQEAPGRGHCRSVLPRWRRSSA